METLKGPSPLRKNQYKLKLLQNQRGVNSKFMTNHHRTEKFFDIIIPLMQ